MDLTELRDELYCSMFENVIEDQMLINYAQKVVARESKLSVRSVTPYTKTQVNFLNGNQFFGDMNVCRMNGSGRYLWADDGSLFEGEFNRPNVIEGRGSFKFHNREKSTGMSKFCGTFLNGKLHGKGQLTNYFFKYNGNFEADKFHGKGNLKSGTETFDGIFKLDKKVCGKRIYSEGVFVGDFYDDETRKFGKYEFENGDVYCGSFDQSMFSGFGEYTWYTGPSGVQCKYVGSWRQNYREGLGMLTVDSVTCVTLFHKNSKHGPGIVWAKNGKIYASNEMYQRDEFVSCEEIEVKQSNIKTLRKLLNMEDLQAKSFRTTLGELVEKYGKGCRQSIYPFHTCWFDLKVNHSAIWKFISTFENTNEDQEFISIAQTVKEFEGKFHELYLRYAQLSSKQGRPSMTRIGLWQLMRDLELFKKGAQFNSQAILDKADREFNIFSLNSDDPFDTVSTACFVHYLMAITLHINKHHDYVLSCAINQRSKIFGLFATMFVIFLREFLVPLLPLQSFNGMISRLVQDDRTFLSNFINVIDLKWQKLSIRNVFDIVGKWKTMKKKPTTTSANELGTQL